MGEFNHLAFGTQKKLAYNQLPVHPAIHEAPIPSFKNTEQTGQQHFMIENPVPDSQPLG